MYDADAPLLQASESPDPAPEGAGPCAGRQLQSLDQLAEAGLQVALAIAARVQAEPAAPLAELAAAGQAYDRVARGVRLCILLQDELIKRRQERAEAERQAPALRRKAHTDRALGVVKRIARDHCRRELWEISAIAKDAAERLDTDDIYGMVESRPIGELVELICRDFGLEPNWDALAQEAWAVDEAESGVEGSPFELEGEHARPPPLAGEGDREAVERACRCDTG